MIVPFVFALILQSFAMLRTAPSYVEGQAGQPAFQSPPVTEGDYAIKDFKFNSGETLRELRIHYRTLGVAQTQTV